MPNRFTKINDKLTKINDSGEIRSVSFEYVA